ncbi:MAG: LON peptidase substrate-binding domain-containing protein [Gammaproteobacteria bacterium]
MTIDLGDENVWAVFPLQTVLFPGGALPLRIFEPRYIDMVGNCLRQGREFAVVAITQGHEARPGAAFHSHGTLARIESWDQGEDGLLHLLARGTERCRVLDHITAPNGLVQARCARVAETATPVSADFAYLARLAESVFLERPELAPARPWLFDDAAWLAYACADLMPLDLGTRLAILTLDGATEKLAKVANLLPPPASTTGLH